LRINKDENKNVLNKLLNGGRHKRLDSNPLVFYQNPGIYIQFLSIGETALYFGCRTV